MTLDTQDFGWAPTETTDWAEPVISAVAPVPGAIPFTAPSEYCATEVAQEQWNNNATVPNWGGFADWH